MTGDGDDPSVPQLREEVTLLRGELAQLGAQLARLDTRTESQGQALDDIEAYVVETAQLARSAAEQAQTQSADDGAGAPVSGVDMRRLVKWVEANITTLVSRKVPTTDGPPRWCPRWWDHAEAIARLEGLRRAWVALSGDQTTGLVIYFDYLDRTLAVLTAETGPFSRCSPRQHAAERTLGHEPPPPEVYEQPTPAADQAPTETS